MAIKSGVKKSWQEVQKKYSYPVNAIGIKIKDQRTLKVWQNEGIDQFLRE